MHEMTSEDELAIQAGAGDPQAFQALLEHKVVEPAVDLLIVPLSN